MTVNARRLNVGVLALQGAFSEHLQLLRKAFEILRKDGSDIDWTCQEVRKPEELAHCDALIIPGGESTTIALVAEQSQLLEPLRTFVKVHRKPTWGTCAGLILLSEAANHTKKGGQELIGGLDVRVNRNHFGRQVESFVTKLKLPFLAPKSDPETNTEPFEGVFIRAPIVEKVLKAKAGVQIEEGEKPGTIVAPSKIPEKDVTAGSINKEVEVMAVLPGRADTLKRKAYVPESSEGDIVAVRQGNCFGTSFHPELTSDERIHLWWLRAISHEI